MSDKNSCRHTLYIARRFDNFSRGFVDIVRNGLVFTRFYRIRFDSLTSYRFTFSRGALGRIGFIIGRRIFLECLCADNLTFRIELFFYNRRRIGFQIYRNACDNLSNTQDGMQHGFDLFAEIIFQIFTHPNVRRC